MTKDELILLQFRVHVLSNMAKNVAEFTNFIINAGYEEDYAANLLEPKLTKFKEMCKVVCDSIDSEDIKNLELQAFLEDIKSKSNSELSKIKE